MMIDGLKQKTAIAAKDFAAVNHYQLLVKLNYKVACFFHLHSVVFHASANLGPELF